MSVNYFFVEGTRVQQVADRQAGRRQSVQSADGTLVII